MSTVDSWARIGHTVLRRHTVFMFAPMVEVRLPRTTSPLLTMRGPLDSEGNLDDVRLAAEIKREMGFEGKVSLSWLAADELGVLSHNAMPILTIRVE